MIDRETIDRIYAAVNIVDIVGDFVTLKRSGANYTACCPFHNEKTPSFVVSPAKGFYKCFGCGKGGNAINFLMEHESLTYPEALKMVAKRYGIEVREKEMTEEEQRQNNDRESMFALNGWAADYFTNYLHHEPEGMNVGMSYLRQKRGMTDATIRKFGLGFCPARDGRMSNAAIAAGYRKEFLLSTGLSIQRESDGSLFDRFRDRVIFPVYNISGRIVAFGGRTLRTDKSVAKYLNSPESEIYSKKRELYGLFFAKKAIQQQDFAILVEGYTDVISMHQSGVENVVASSGTSLTTEQIQLLRRFTKNITVIYDGDSAGIHASLRGIDMILHEGMNVRVVLLPEPEDPDSFARSHTAEELQRYIREHEEDFLRFKIRLLMKEAQGDPIRRANLIRDMVESIVQVPDAILRSVYIKDCARMMEIDEQVLIGEVARKRLTTTGDRETDDFLRRQSRRIAREQAAETPAGNTTPATSASAEIAASVDAGSNIHTLEHELLKYLLKYGHRFFDFKEGRQMVSCNVAQVIFDELSDGDLKFRDPVYEQIRNLYKSAWDETGPGVEVPGTLFLQQADPKVSETAVDLLTDGDNYVASSLWERKEVHVEQTEELLAIGVPKAVTLYKIKVIDELIKQLSDQLKQEDDLPEEKMGETMQRLALLNQARTTMANKVKRLIV